MDGKRMVEGIWSLLVMLTFNRHVEGVLRVGVGGFEIIWGRKAGSNRVRTTFPIRQIVRQGK